jgi:hypothetical protein
MAKLMDLFVPEASVLDMKARTRNEALRELADASAGAVAEIDADELYERLLKRENLGATALGDGVATPGDRSFKRAFRVPVREILFNGVSELPLGGVVALTALPARECARSPIARKQLDGGPLA